MNKKVISNNLKEQNNLKDSINKKLSDYNLEIDIVNNSINNLNKERMDTEKIRSNYSEEIKDNEHKLKNLVKESENYNGEIENIKKSLSSAKENLKTFNSLLADFQKKIAPLDFKQNNFLKLKKELKNGLKLEKADIKEAATLLKKSTPAATVIIDLAEDEALNEFNDHSENKAKLKNLIEEIINCVQSH